MVKNIPVCYKKIVICLNVKTIDTMWTHRRVLVRCLKFGPLASVTEPAWQLSLTGTHNKPSLLPYCLLYDKYWFCRKIIILLYIKQHLSCPCIYLQCLCFKSLGWSRWKRSWEHFYLFLTFNYHGYSIYPIISPFILISNHPSHNSQVWLRQCTGCQPGLSQNIGGI